MLLMNGVSFGRGHRTPGHFCERVGADGERRAGDGGRQRAPTAGAERSAPAGLHINVGIWACAMECTWEARRALSSCRCVQRVRGGQRGRAEGGGRAPEPRAQFLLYWEYCIRAFPYLQAAS